MRKTRLSELFAFENVVNDKTDKAKVLVWNNRTMLIAEENSELFLGSAEAFDDIIFKALSFDNETITLLLFSALSSAYEGFDYNEFADYFDEKDFIEYQKAVVEGLSNYLPSTDYEDEETEDQKEQNNYEIDQWATLYFFAKKYLLMTDEEFLNSTWRKITILQKEFSKTISKSNEDKENINSKFIDNVDWW